MKINITKADIIWSYLGYFLKFGSNLIIMPMVLKILPGQELGIWYVFLSVGSLVFLLDFGFSPTIMRNITYGWTGARGIEQEGVSVQTTSEEGACFELVYRIFIVSKRIYLYISAAALVLMLSAGTYYIQSLSHDLKNAGGIMVAWLIYCAGTFINLCFFYWIPVLSGIGRIKEGQKATVVSQLFYVITAYVGLGFGFGIISISAAFLLSGIVFRVMSMYYFYNVKGVRENFTLAGKNIKFTDCRNIFKAMWHNTYKLGLVTLGAYLVQQSNTIICSMFLGLEATAIYGLSLQLFNGVGGFSLILFRNYLPLFNEARIRNDIQKLKKYFSISVVVSLACFLTGGICIVFLGQWVVTLIGSGTELMGRGMLVFMLFYQLLEFNHGSIFSTFITTKNEVPFTVPALISGGAIVIISVTLVTIARLGLWGLLLSQCVVQLAYNNWKWPYVVLKEMGMSVTGLIKTGCSNIYLISTEYGKRVFLCGGDKNELFRVKG